MGPAPDVIQFSRDEDTSADNTVGIYTRSAKNCDPILAECTYVNQSRHLPYCAVIKGPNAGLDVLTFLHNRKWPILSC